MCKTLAHILAQNRMKKRLMTQLKAIIFDVDGTLAETERDGHRVAFNRAFSNAGLDWYWDEELYAQLLAVTGGKERIRFYLEKFRTDNMLADEMDALIKQLHQAKTRYYTEILQSKAIPLRPGVERLLDEAQQAGIKLAIATTTTPANVDALLIGSLGADALERFETIAAGDVVPAKKPAADIFHYCLEKLNLPAKACLAVEDSVNGLKAARGAGIETIVTINSYTQHEDFSGALSVFDHLGEPNQACTCIAGAAVSNSYIRVDDLKELHEQAYR